MKTTQKDYDHSGFNSNRLLANFLRWKAMPFGYIERGPGIVWLASIWLRHKIGRQLITFRYKNPQQFNRLINLVGRVRSKLRI